MSSSFAVGQTEFSAASARAALATPPINKTVQKIHSNDLLVSPINTTVAVPTASADGLTAEQAELLSYYRARLDSFEDERADFIKRIDDLSGTVKERHRLKWDLNRRDEQISDLQKALSDAHMFLYQERERLLNLATENDQLKLKESEDRKRIQHLLSLTEPVCQEVTYFRDARPEKIHRNFPVNRQKILDNQKNEEEMANENNQGEIRRQIIDTSKENRKPKRQPSMVQENSNSSTASESIASTQSRRQAFGARITGQKPPQIPSQQRVVRTIFMPNESLEVLNQLIEQLRNQAAEQKILFEQRVKALEEDRTIREVEHKEALSKAQETIENYQKDVKELNKRNEQTTKDYLALRHEAQARERKIREENAKLSKRGEILKNQYEKAQTDAERVRRDLNIEHVHYVDLYQRQTSASEEDLAIIKAQYAATQDLYEKRIQYLEGKLAQSKSRCQQVEERRNLEFEGFGNDVKNLRLAVKNLESLIGKLRGNNEIPAERKIFNMTAAIQQQQGMAGLNEEIQQLQSELSKLARKLSTR